jgi:hypothetical protein
MPSQLHESHVLLFRNQPALAAALIRDVLHWELPTFSEARVISAELNDVQPAEYRADLVIELRTDEAVSAIIVEVQLSVDGRKEYTWPAYVANLYARLERPVILLVIAADESVARWASRRIAMGGPNYFKPFVIGPSRVPEVIDEVVARENPELAVLSAMAHGDDADVDRAIQIARIAHATSEALDADRSKLYCDLILNSLGEAALNALMKMDVRKFEFRSEVVRTFVAHGRAEGWAEGRAELITTQLETRFGPLSTETKARIVVAKQDELDRIGKRLLCATSLEDALAPHA